MLVDNKINKIHINKSIDSHLSSNKNVVIAKGDSGALANYWRDKDKRILQHIHPNTSISITLPNNNPINSTLSGTIPLSNKLLSKVKKATVLPNLHSSSLISLGQLCNDDCQVILDKKELNVYKDSQVLLKGYQNLKNSLWDIPIVGSITPDNFIMPATHSGMYSSQYKQHQSSTTKKQKEEMY